MLRLLSSNPSVKQKDLTASPGKNKTRAQGRRSRGTEASSSPRGLIASSSGLLSASDPGVSAPAESISLTFFQLLEEQGEVVWNTSEG